jgi:integrase
MVKTPPNLWLRHRTWFLRLSIPPSLRHHFAGRDQIVESLHTDALSTAIIERDKRVAEYRARFERLRTGAPPTEAELASAIAQVTPPPRPPPQPRKMSAEERARERAFIDSIIVKMIETQCAAEIQATAEKLGITIERGSTLWRDIGTRILDARLDAGEAVKSFSYADDGSLKSTTLSLGPPLPIPATPAVPSTASAAPALAANGGEKFSDAFSAHVTELERAGTRATTITSYRQMAGAFQEWCKDAPIASITRAMASDFLVELGATRSNNTVNQYAALLAAVFETARRRGRFTGDNGFKDQKRRAEVKSYEAFTGADLTKLFALTTFEVKPKTHTTATALPWAALIAAFSGMRREEVAQLRWQDLREIDGVWTFDVTPVAGKLKTKSSERVVPVHSTLISQGLLDYHANLPRGGRLFPGLKARASKGGKLGAALGDAFEAWRKSVGLVRDGLTFHSFRHGVAEALDRAGVAETDAARILGHDIPGMSFGVYSGGPGLKRLQAEVEKIEFPGLYWL